MWNGGIATPFGEGVNLAGANAQKLMFPGQYADLETEGAGVTLAHNWHRTYDPTLGRYLQSDPIGLAGGLNRYAYVGGNPMSYVDPRGLKCTGPGPGCTFGPRDPVTGEFTYIKQSRLSNETILGMNSVVPAITLGMGSTGRINSKSGDICSSAKKIFGQQGPIFGQSRLGAPTSGYLNHGKYRIGFTAHGNRAVFRVGIKGNHVNLFSRPRVPRDQWGR